MSEVVLDVVDVTKEAVICDTVLPVDTLVFSGCKEAGNAEEYS
jgi:hypothetical protein